MRVSCGDRSRGRFATPILLSRIVARAEGFTYAVGVWDASIVQATFSANPNRANSHLWLKVHGAHIQAVESAEDLEVDRMEQQSIMHAQVLVSPSAYLLSWITSKGWALPSHANVFVQPYIMPQEARRAIAEAVAASPQAR